MVVIGPQMAEEIVNGQTDRQIQIIVWCMCKWRVMVTRKLVICAELVSVLSVR